MKYFDAVIIFAKQEITNSPTERAWIFSRKIQQIIRVH